MRQADDVSESLTVTYQVESGSEAVEGTDFLFPDANGQVTFAPFETRKTLEVSPLSASEPTGPLSLLVEIVEEDFYMIGARPVAEVVIRDTDLSVDAGADKVVAASSPGGNGTATLSGSSPDADRIDRWIWSLTDTGAVLGSGQTFAAELPVGGPYTITLSGESEDLMETVTDQVRVSVVDFGQLPPVAAVADTGTILAADGRVAEVTLDGAPSSDPDGSVVAWTWFHGGSPIASGETAMASLHVGAHELTLRAEDNDGNIDETVFTVEVLDGTYEIYLVDFGPEAPADSEWNQVDQFHTGGVFDNQPRTDHIPLTSTHGTQTAVFGDIAFHSSRLFMNTGSEFITAPASDWIPADVSTDSLLVFDDNGTAFLDFAVSGLDAGKRYDLELFCTRNDANWETISVWVNSLPATGTHSSMDFQLRFNTGKTLVWHNMTPVDGRLRVQMNGPPDESRRLPLVAMRIVEKKAYPTSRYTLSVTGSVPKAVELKGGGRVFAGDEVFAEAVLTDPDYRFVQWSDGNTSPQRTVSMESDLSMYAIVEPVATETAYEQWAQGHWPGEDDAALVGKAADPDRDGVVNLLEYALNSSPSLADSRAGIVVEMSDAGELQVRFHQVADPLLLYRLSRRTYDPDLDWQEIWSTTGSGNELGERIIQPSVSGARTEFYRLSVEYDAGP